jgi:hypothetical protein
MVGYRDAGLMFGIVLPLRGVLKEKRKGGEEQSVILEMVEGNVDRVVPDRISIVADWE